MFDISVLDRSSAISLPGLGLIILPVLGSRRTASLFSTSKSVRHLTRPAVRRFQFDEATWLTTRIRIRMKNPEGA